jgi:hypothetical protein
VKHVVPVTGKLASGAHLRYEPIVARQHSPRLHTRASLNRTGQRVFRARPFLMPGPGSLRRSGKTAPLGNLEVAPLEVADASAKLAEVFEAFDPGAVEEVKLTFKAGTAADGSRALLLDRSTLGEEMDAPILEKIVAVRGLGALLSGKANGTVTVTAVLEVGDGGAAKVTIVGAR